MLCRISHFIEQKTTQSLASSASKVRLHSAITLAIWKCRKEWVEYLLLVPSVCHRKESVWMTLITGRNEVVAKVMFLLVSVILLTGGVSGREHPPLAVRPPRQGDPPVARRPTPPGRENPPWQGEAPLCRETPPRQEDSPLARRTPPGRENPPQQGEPTGREIPPAGRLPLARRTPLAGRTPPGRENPPWQGDPPGKQTPQQGEPPSRETPLAGRPPPAGRPLQARSPPSRETPPSREAPPARRLPLAGSPPPPRLQWGASTKTIGTNS